MTTSDRDFPAIIRDHARVAICGGPRTGKTTLSITALAARPGVRIVHTDDYISMGWSEASEYAAKTLNELGGPFVVEGVAVPRALRKGLLVDAVVWLDVPHGTLSKGQQAMAKGVRTVLDEWRASNPDVPVFELRSPTGTHHT